MISMPQFTRAITRKPGKSLVEGLTSKDLGKPDYSLAVEQHDTYVKILESLGLDVTVMEANEDYPDSVFVEDPAIVTPGFAVITNPGAPTRRGEADLMADLLPGFFPDNRIHRIEEPGTLDGGDVLMIGQQCFIGLSDRTNREGADQLAYFLNNYNILSERIPVEQMLHLKTGLTYLGNQQLLAKDQFLGRPEFEGFEMIRADSANSLSVNGKILVANGFPEARRMIMDLGYSVIDVDFSEFLKIDGGLSCLSLRF